MCYGGHHGFHGPSAASLAFIYGFSNQNYNFYNILMWKNVHPVSGAGIQTHNLSNVTLLP